jgi:hypothetical protein
MTELAAADCRGEMLSPAAVVVAGVVFCPVRLRLLAPDHAPRSS